MVPVKHLEGAMGEVTKVPDTQVTITGADRRGMLHDILLGLGFVAMILSPCLVALGTSKDIDQE